MLRFFCTEGGESKPLQIKNIIPLPSPCRRGLGRGSGRGKGEGSDPSVNDQQYPPLKGGGERGGERVG